jgi:hypothetical protein
MPRFIPNKEGQLIMHPTDCSTCESWSEEPFTDEEDVEEMLANFIHVSVDRYQGMSDREMQIRLYSRCQQEARKIKNKVDRKRRLEENRQSFDAWMAAVEKKEEEEAAAAAATAKENEVEKEVEEEKWE